MIDLFKNTIIMVKKMSPYGGQISLVFKLTNTLENVIRFSEKISERWKKVSRIAISILEMVITLKLLMPYFL